MLESGTEGFFPSYFSKMEIRTLLMISFNCGLPLKERKASRNNIWELPCSFQAKTAWIISSFHSKAPISYPVKLQATFPPEISKFFVGINLSIAQCLWSYGAQRALFWHHFYGILSWALWQPKLRSINNDCNILSASAYLTNRRHTCEKRKVWLWKRLKKIKGNIFTAFLNLLKPSFKDEYTFCT